MNTETVPTAADALALVVFGRDEAGKAHGSAFTAADAELATKAAELMGMRALPIRTEVECTLAAKLPRGRVFASGKAFVPFIKATLLTELQTAALNSGLPPLSVVGGAAEGKASKPIAVAPAEAVERSRRTKQPTGWGDIAVGAIVLAAFSREHAEWYECVVLAVEGKNSFKLRYCDWPNEPTFVRSRDELALIPPAYPLELPLEPNESTAVA